MTFDIKRSVLAAVASTTVICFFGATLASGQDVPLARDVFINVPALGHIPVDEFMDTMGMYSASLNLNCTDCHTEESGADWESFGDETPLKATARAMTMMVSAINRDNFGGARVVTCFTCHHGAEQPEVIPDLRLQYGVPDEDPNNIEVYPAAGAFSADEVFDNYLEALGGAERVAAVTSLVAMGTYSGYDTSFVEAPLEVFARAPNQRTLIVHSPFGDSVRVFNGSEGWIAAGDKPVPLMPLTGGNIEGARVEAIMTFPAELQAAFNRWQVGWTFFDDEMIQVLQGRSGRDLPVNFYFDASGLLVRMVRWVDTAVGVIPTQVDYEDYREVEGVQIPFRSTVTWTNGQSTMQLSEVQLNAPVSAARFAQPEPAQPPSFQ